MLLCLCLLPVSLFVVLLPCRKQKRKRKGVVENKSILLLQVAFMILVCGVYFFQLFCCLFGSKRTLCLFPDCQLTFVVWLLCKFWRRNLEGEKTEQEKGSTGTCPPTLSLPWAVRGGLCMCPSSAVLGRSLTRSDNARSPLLSLPATQPKHEDECKFRLGT